MENLGKNIRLLRVQRKMSQDQLAEALHVTRQTISNYETGRSRPDVEMLTALAEALDADVKEILYAPADRETHIRRLRRLAVSAVVTALVGVLDAVGIAWGRQPMQVSYIGAISYLVVYIVHPLFYLLLGWTLARGCLVLLRTDPPEHRWAVWARWGLLAVMALWLVVMVPFFLYLADGAYHYLFFRQDFSHISVTPTLFLFSIISHPKAIAWGNLLWGGALGILGFPGRRAVKDVSEPDAAQIKKIDSPE